MDKASRGAAALKESNFAEAIKQYTAAIAENPRAVDYYIKRSTAHQRSSPPNYQEALSDAEIAVVLAHQRAKRELIKDSQLRRGIALFHLERYADAEHVFALVAKLDKDEKTLTIWNMKVAAKLKTLPENDERRKVNVKDVPKVDVPIAGEAKVTTQAVSTAASSSQPKPVVPTPASKIKHDWYQNSENVYFTLLAKGVPKDKATIEIEKDSLSISFPTQESSSFDYSIDPFFASVKPESSTYNITPTKVEVTLKKATPGVKWHQLEGSKMVDPRTESEEQRPKIPESVLNPTNIGAPPSYPTSSKQGPKNWDKVVDDLTAKKAKEGETGVGAEEDYLEDEEGGDSTTKFFKQLYKGLDPDSQRAMMKSFSQSGGTVLSTDWNDIGKREVIPEPPEGMEAKKY